MKVSDDHIQIIENLATQYLGKIGVWPSKITDAREAWDIYDYSGAMIALKHMDYKDAHLQTALERVFPNALFFEAKRY